MQGISTWNFLAQSLVWCKYYLINRFILIMLSLNTYLIILIQYHSLTSNPGICLSIYTKAPRKNQFKSLLPRKSMQVTRSKSLWKAESSAQWMQCGEFWVFIHIQHHRLQSPLSRYKHQLKPKRWLPIVYVPIWCCTMLALELQSLTPWSTPSSTNISTLESSFQHATPTIRIWTM